VAEQEVRDIQSLLVAIRVGAIMSHPTQYHSPWFRELAGRREVELEVLYCFNPTPEQQGAGFGVPFEWDVDLLEGYEYRFLRNVSKTPGFSFNGCDTPGLGSVLDERSYDVFMVNGWNVRSYWQAMRECWARELPLLIRGDSHLLKRASLARRLVKRVALGRWFSRCAAFLTVGSLNEEFFKHYGCDPTRFFPVRHFVDNEWFAARATADSDRLSLLRDRWNVTEGSLVVLFAGKFAEGKRPMDAIAAVERCKGAPVHLLMVGDGPLREECEQYVINRALPVSFTGFLNQRSMPDAYALADLLVLPSKTETWGLVVNEAMACGIPAVVSDGSGCAPDLIIEDETGLTFPVGDVSALSRALFLYANAPLRARREGLQAASHIASYNKVAAANETVRACQFAVAARHARERQQ
jgi:glycosyltransferase involved in cell wall biosynthesis